MKIFALFPSLIMVVFSAHAFVIEDLKQAILSSNPEICRNLLPSAKLTKNKCDLLITFADSIIEKRRTQCIAQCIVPHLSLKKVAFFVAGWINCGVSKALILEWVKTQLANRSLSKIGQWVSVLILPVAAMFAASGIYLFVRACKTATTIDRTESESLYLNSIEIKYILQNHRITIKD